jgi:4'-phosphopantetheinyl transferase
VLPTGDVVHVWHIGPDLPAPVAAALAGLLSAQESERWHSYLSPARRSSFLAAHGAARVILAGYLSVPPADLRLRTGRWGKPEVIGSPVRFSLSHSGRSILLAVTGRRDVGVDIERAGDPEAMTRLARRFFRPEEAALLGGAEPSTVFLRLWTRKEACVKAAGGRLVEGMRLPVQDPLVHDPYGRLPGPWLVRDLPAPPGYGAAVALGGSRPYEVISRQWRSSDVPVR